MIMRPTGNKSLILIIVFLLLANIGIVIYLVTGKERPKQEGSRKEAMIKYLKNDLAYNESQLKIFDSLQEKHNTSIQGSFDSIRAEKRDRFGYLVQHQFSDSAIEAASKMMAAQQGRLEMKMLHHLKAVRSIGNTEQQQKFDTTFFKAMSRKRPGIKKQKQ